MAFQFKMPDIGEGIAEGEIVKIDIKVGDTIQEDDILFEVQNDKSVEEIPSPVSGKVLEVKVQEGTVARVGDIIVVIDDGSGPAEALLSTMVLAQQKHLHQQRLQRQHLHQLHQQQALSNSNYLTSVKELQKVKSLKSTSK